MKDYPSCFGLLNSKDWVKIVAWDWEMTSERNPTLLSEASREGRSFQCSSVRTWPGEHDSIWVVREMEIWGIMIWWQLIHLTGPSPSKNCSKGMYQMQQFCSVLEKIKAHLNDIQLDDNHWNIFTKITIKWTICHLDNSQKDNNNITARAHDVHT